MSTLVVRALSALTAGALVSAAIAQPTNTTLPGGGGWSWVPVPAMNGTYDTGLQGTPRGGAAGQTVGPFTDTSYGVMDETGTPWFTGSDQSAQQYVQRQLFGNFGTAGASGRFFNSGFGGTTSGSNFPRAATEQRSATLNHWNNSNPDAGGVASFGQVVFVPVSATLSIGNGFGADEMLLRIIGGNSGQRSQFFIDGTLNQSASTTAFGGITNNAQIRVNAIVQANDAGPGSYDVAWGYGASNPSQVNLSRSGGIDAVFVNGAFVQDPSQGIPPNSVGYSFTQNFNVLSTLVQNGGSFSVLFNASAEINNLVRNSGNADARAQMGPGMEGTARLVVQWQAFRAIPTPGAAALLGLGTLAMTRRRR
jgi:hypothetical protein